MKTHSDPRHLHRIRLMQQLFSWDFNHQEDNLEAKAKDMVSKMAEIDAKIVSAATDWPIAKINKVDLSIIRLAAYELLIEKDTPPKVVVDEAVELAKEFGSDTSSSFINGSLGKMIEDLEKLA